MRLDLHLYNLPGLQSDQCVGVGGGGGDTHPLCRMSQVLGEVGDLAEQRQGRSRGRA